MKTHSARGVFQNAFWDNLVQHLVGELETHFQDRLVSVYVTGSVHRREAVVPRPLGSDPDLVVIIADQFSQEDRAWRSQINDNLHEQIPELPWSTMPRAYPLAMVEPSETAWEAGSERDAALIKHACDYQFKYDATLVFGRDLVKNNSAPVPGRLWARTVFQQPWDLVRHTAGLEPGRITENTEANSSEWPLPQSLGMKLRKLARLAVLGAACLAMADGKFESFHGAVLLPPLKPAHPEWHDFLEMTEAYYMAVPAEGNEAIAQYLPLLVSWMDWVGATLWAGGG